MRYKDNTIFSITKKKAIFFDFFFFPLIFGDD